MSSSNYPTLRAIAQEQIDQDNPQEVQTTVKDWYRNGLEIQRRNKRFIVDIAVSPGAKADSHSITLAQHDLDGSMIPDEIKLQGIKLSTVEALTRTALSEKLGALNYPALYLLREKMVELDHKSAAEIAPLN